MSHSDIDPTVPPQDSVTLPWESIDPAESAEDAETAKPMAQTKKPRRKAKAGGAASLRGAGSSVSVSREMEGTDPASAQPSADPFKPVFRTLPQTSGSSPASLTGEAEEEVVAHAFLSDEATDFIEVAEEPEVVPDPAESAVAADATEPPPTSFPQSVTVAPAVLPRWDDNSDYSATVISEPTPGEQELESEATARSVLSEGVEPPTDHAADLDALLEQLSSDDAADLQALSMAAPVEKTRTREESTPTTHAPVVSVEAGTDLEKGGESPLATFAVGSALADADKLGREQDAASAKADPTKEAEPASVVSPSVEDARDDIEGIGNDTLLVPVNVEAAIDYASLATEPQSEARVEPQPAQISEPDVEMEHPTSAATTGGGWTIPLMCAGICLIACCLVIPQADFNRRLMYERIALQANLDSVQKQVRVNDAFLAKVMNDPNLAERLASRQLKTIRKGQKVLAMNAMPGEPDMSPFSLTTVAPPPVQLTYKPVVGTIADLCNSPRTKLYLLGAAMTMVAVGLVMGFSPKTRG